MYELSTGLSPISIAWRGLAWFGIGARGWSFRFVAGLLSSMITKSRLRRKSWRADHGERSIRTKLPGRQRSWWLMKLRLRCGEPLYQPPHF